MLALQIYSNGWWVQALYHIACTAASRTWIKTTARKAGHRSNLASLRFRVNAATERRKHTHVDLLWITQRFRTIAVFPINWERLDAGIFTPVLPATKRKSRTFATRETDVIFERKHCSRRRRHTQVEFSLSRKCADKTQTIARKRWHGARKRKRSNVRSTCGRLKVSEWSYSMANLTMFPNFLGFILLVCYRGDITWPTTIEKPSVAICFVNGPFWA